MGNDLHRFESCLQLAEVVADGTQIQDPRFMAFDAQRQQADVTGPGIETIAFARAIGFQIERNRMGFANRGGDGGEVTHLAYHPFNRVRTSSDVSDG